jgi:hypothetical protein
LRTDARIASALAASVLVSFSALTSTRAATFVVPMPDVKPIAVTPTSHPWLYDRATQRPLDLEKFGFVEEEFLVSGAANVYDWPADASQSLIVKYRNAPYATRILMRRPADLSKFSGTVVVEVMNPARGFDMAIMHGFLSDSLLERGDAWVGISTPGVIDSLKRFDASRYGAVSFANPAPAEVVCAGGRGRGGRGGADAVPQAGPSRNPVEPGLRLDAFAQIGRWVRGAPGNPLAAAVRNVFLIGHTGGDVATYVSSVGHEARLDNGKPVYDGYIAHSGSTAGALMNCGTPLAPGDVRTIPGRAGVPVIVMKTQTDLPYPGRPDSDAADDIFRVYDIPGSAHADKWLFRYLPTVAEQRKATDVAVRTPVTDEWPFDLTCDIPDIRMNDFPQGHIVAGAVANLERYARDGSPLPKAPRIETETVGGVTKVTLDQYGNAKGGIRSPYVDAPTGTFHAKLSGALTTCADMTYHEVWDWWRTAAVYGSYDTYAAKVNASIDAMVRGRWITEASARHMRAELLKPAGR